MGEFRKTEKVIRKVIGYRAYIQNFKVIGRYFEIGGFAGGFPPKVGISENGQNSSFSNVPEKIHAKFQGNLTKFRNFGIFGGKSPPWMQMGGNFGKTEKGIR